MTVPAAAILPRVVLAAACAVLLGCTAPEVGGDAGDGDAREEPLAATPPDPSVDRVASATEALQGTLEEARTAITDAVDADDLATASSAADRTLAALVVDRGVGSEPSTGALFPAETTDRGSSAQAEDRFTRTLTVARDGGDPGSQLLDLLRDPLAGDLGAWQRDAAGMVSVVESVASGGGSLEQLEAEVAELAGLGTQAIAWTLLTRDADDLEAARAFAERAQASLDVVLVTLERFVEELDEERTARPGAPGVDPEEQEAA